MNTINKTAPSLSATLKSLSFDPGQTHKPPVPKRTWLALAPLALAIGCISFFVIQNDEDLAERPAATTSKPPVEASPPTPAPQNEITGTGYVVAPQTTLIFSNYEGTVVNVPVSAGDKVLAGQVLVVVDDTRAKLELRKADSASQTARLVLSQRAIQVEQAKTTVDRFTTLMDRGAASRQQRDDAITAHALALNALNQARQDLEGTEVSIAIAQHLLDKLTIRSPFAGTITRLNVKAGDTVLAQVDSARDNQSLMTVSNTSHLLIDADIAETSIRLLRPGMNGEAILDGFPDQLFTVRIESIAPIASSEKGTITLRLSIDNPPVGIRPNMAASIRIAVTQPESNRS